MSRVINPNLPGKERNRLRRAIALALRELMRETEPTSKARDLSAFIALSLEAINGTVNTTVAAWEKRDYWVKADRFRMDWEWAVNLGAAMRQAVLSEDWAAIALNAAKIAPHLSDVKVSDRHRMGTPWVGAWKHIQEG
ncbi:MAG: hypothetical protein ABFS03_13105 [Chloroflexota bacterium]